MSSIYYDTTIWKLIYKIPALHVPTSSIAKYQNYSCNGFFFYVEFYSYILDLVFNMRKRKIMKKDSYDEYLAIRRNAQSIVTTSEGSIEQCIFKLAYGIFGIIAAIYPFIKEHGVDGTYYLIIGWLFAGVSLIGNILSILIAKRYAEKMIKYIDTQISNNNDFSEKNMNALILRKNKRIDLFNKFSVSCLIIGIVFILLFMIK